MPQPPETGFELLAERADWPGAWHRVEENHGGPGSDGVTIEEFESGLESELRMLAEELASARYRPLPLIEIEVEETIRSWSKHSGAGEILKRKRRILRVPTVRDRVAQTAIAQIIEPWIEEQLEDSSFGYRRGRGVQDAVEEVRKWYLQGFHFVVDADIDDYFDSVDHGRLIEKFKQSIDLPLRIAMIKMNPAASTPQRRRTGERTLQNLTRLITLWTQAEVWNGKEIYWLTRGLPQGSVLSPLLSNLFLDELDEHLLGNGFKLVRYADDFVILCKHSGEANDALKLTEHKLRQLGLALNREKSKVTRFDDTFKFLGVFFWKDVAMLPFGGRVRERTFLRSPPPLPPDLARQYRMTVKT